VVFCFGAAPNAQRKKIKNLCSWRVSNPRPLAHKTNTLPTELQEAIPINETKKDIGTYRRGAEWRLPFTSEAFALPIELSPPRFRIPPVLLPRLPSVVRTSSWPTVWTRSVLMPTRALTQACMATLAIRFASCLSSSSTQSPSNSARCCCSCSTWPPHHCGSHPWSGLDGAPYGDVQQPSGFRNGSSTLWRVFSDVCLLRRCNIGT
jgi:hypothetical protein